MSMQEYNVYNLVFYWKALKNSDQQQQPYDSSDLGTVCIAYQLYERWM